MTDVRALRISRQLTLTELAIETGIPARTLAEIEYGLRKLDRQMCQTLARTFRIPAARLRQDGIVRNGADWEVQRVLQSGVGVALAAVAGVTLANPLALTTSAQLPLATPQSQPTITASTAAPPSVPAADELLQDSPSTGDAFLSERLAPAAAYLPPTTIPTATAEPTALSTVTTEPTTIPTIVASNPQQTVAVAPGQFALRSDGPHGCPLLGNGAITITQGYGIGSHAPAESWGAIDLVLADGETLGATVVSTLDGVARVFPDSWPGGNFVLIEGDGWSVAFGHLASIAVADGQTVSAGTVIGSAGSTGYSTGPHLHYEVRTPHGNIDPAPLIGCQS